MPYWHLFVGDPAEIRTPDTLLKRQVLCRLSYWVIFNFLSLLFEKLDPVNKDRIAVFFKSMLCFETSDRDGQCVSADLVGAVSFYPGNRDDNPVTAEGIACSNAEADFGNISSRKLTSAGAQDRDSYDRCQAQTNEPCRILHSFPPKENGWGSWI